MRLYNSEIDISFDKAINLLSINEYSFGFCKCRNVIKILENIETIGEGAFLKSEFSDVDFSRAERLEKIHDDAFLRCVNFNNIKIPKI